MGLVCGASGGTWPFTEIFSKHQILFPLIFPFHPLSCPRIRLTVLWEHSLRRVPRAPLPRPEWPTSSESLRFLQRSGPQPLPRGTPQPRPPRPRMTATAALQGARTMPRGPRRPRQPTGQVRLLGGECWRAWRSSGLRSLLCICPCSVTLT